MVEVEQIKQEFEIPKIIENQDISASIIEKLTPFLKVNFEDFNKKIASQLDDFIKEFETFQKGSWNEIKRFYETDLKISQIYTIWLIC